MFENMFENMFEQIEKEIRNEIECRMKEAREEIEKKTREEIREEIENRMEEIKEEIKEEINFKALIKETIKEMELEKVIGELSENEHKKNLIFGLISRAGGKISRTKLIQNSHIKSQELTELCDTLIECGEIHMYQDNNISYYELGTGKTD